MVRLRLEEVSPAFMRAVDHADCVVFRARAGNGRDEHLLTVCWTDGIVLANESRRHDGEPGHCPGCGVLLLRSTGLGRPQIYCTPACGQRHRRSFRRL